MAGDREYLDVELARQGAGACQLWKPEGFSSPRRAHPVITLSLMAGSSCVLLRGARARASVARVSRECRASSAREAQSWKPSSEASSATSETGQRPGPP